MAKKTILQAISGLADKKKHFGEAITQKTLDSIAGTFSLSCAVFIDVENLGRGSCVIELADIYHDTGYSTGYSSCSFFVYRTLEGHLRYEIEDQDFDEIYDEYGQLDEDWFTHVHESMWNGVANHLDETSYVF